MADIVEVDELPDTERGAAGFGSTGVAAATAMEVEVTKRARIENGKDYVVHSFSR